MAGPVVSSGNVTLHEMQVLEIIGAEKQPERTVSRLVCIRKEGTEGLKLMHNERNRETPHAGHIKGLSRESTGRMINRTRRAACCKHINVLDGMENHAGGGVQKDPGEVRGVS